MDNSTFVPSISLELYVSMKGLPWRSFVQFG